MDKSAEKYYQELNDDVDAKKEESIYEGNCLDEMMKTQGWKIIADIIEKVKDIKRLQIAPDNVSNIKLHEVTYIAGQIEGVEKLLNAINAKIAQRNALIKDQAEIE